MNKVLLSLVLLFSSAHQSLAASGESKLHGYGFSLRDIERRCEVFKSSDSDSYGEVECRGSSFRIIERKCEAYFYDTQNAELDCQGSDFRVIERKCSVSMYSEDYGDIDCY